MRPLRHLGLLSTLLSYVAFGQAGASLSGGVQLELRSYRADSAIGAPAVPERLGLNAYVPLSYRLGAFSVSLRYEAYLQPLQGYDRRYAGSGIAFRSLEYQDELFQLTVGGFYEQFGSGMVLRAYEERLLGIDNGLEGVRLRYNGPGIRLTGFVARQRRFFEWTGLVRGADVELNPSAWGIGTPLSWQLGASVVSKYQPDTDPLYRLPENVLAYALRGSWQWESWRLTAEWAYKYNDPSALNGYSYNPGTGLYVTLAGELAPVSFLLQAKRIDNMAFYSDRTASGTVSVLNYLAPLSRQQTYRLATLYPYATQPGGEIGIAAEAIISLPEESLLGGEGGGTLTLSYSRIHGLDTVHTGELRYRSRFPGIGRQLYLEEFVAEHTVSWTPRLRSTVNLTRQIYNRDVSEGVRGYGLIWTWIAIADVAYTFAPRQTVRAELQHLWTRQDRGRWLFALLEYSLAPRLAVTVWDEYNYGNPDRSARFHYPGAAVTLLLQRFKLALGYGRQRAGIVCVGGVCRYMPAANGLSLSVTATL
ncbi:MAG: DUF6029 family protein [Candidatus Kapabacteria bacterium]|nr:DUF6029 family protein [Candidatus Kapabacteria bacterium]MDW8011370.1 DUF6029 family protein [Bacteroidota bacterium]